MTGLDVSIYEHILRKLNYDVIPFVGFLMLTCIPPCRKNLPSFCWLVLAVFIEACRGFNGAQLHASANACEPLYLSRNSIDHVDFSLFVFRFLGVRDRSGGK